MTPQIPRTWATCEIGEVAEVVGGGTPPSKDPTNFADENGIPWITPADLSGYREMYIGVGARNLSPKGLDVSSAMVLPKGAVLFSSRAPIGYTAIALNPLSTSQGFKSFVLADGIDSRYVYYYLKYIKPLVQDRATGTTFKEISAEAASRLPFVVAPEGEQKRIADKLDKVVSLVEGCLRHLDRLPSLVSRLRRVVVTAATNGELTAEWRASNVSRVNTGSVDDGWDKRPLSELCDPERVITYGVVKLGNEQSSGTPCLRTSNVRWLRIDVRGIKRISPVISAKYARTILRGGEVLVNVRGTLGGVAVASPEMSGWNVSREVAVVPVDPERIDAAYLALWIASDVSQRWLGRARKGVAYRGINIEDLRTLPVVVPSLDEQRDIVRRVNDLFAYADQIDARYGILRDRVERLVPSLWAKAFSGGLVSQDPTEEPAAALLERIRNVRVTGGVSNRKRRTGTRRRVTNRNVEHRIVSRTDIEADHLTSILREKGPLEAGVLWSMSRLGIDDFYDQLKDEEAYGFLIERRDNASSSLRLLMALS